jgi:hypothetical protein
MKSKIVIISGLTFIIVRIVKNVNKGVFYISVREILIDMLCITLILILNIGVLGVK